MVEKRKTKRGGRLKNDSFLDANEIVAFVGNQIRKLRSDRRLTLKQLSEKAEVSASLLSLIERGKATPSIATLVAVASALRTHVSDLFDDRPAEQSSPLRRRAEQPVFETTDGIRRRIALSDHSHGIEMFFSEYGPEAGMGSTPLRYSGVDYGILLEGNLIVEVDGQRYKLRKGDSISYNAEAPHRIQNPTKKTARIVWVKLVRR